MGACNVKISPVVSTGVPAPPDCMASSPEVSTGVPALVDCTASSPEASIGLPSDPGRMSSSPDVSIGVPALVDCVTSSPDVSIGRPSHLCHEVSKGVPAHLDFPGSSPAVSIGQPAHLCPEVTKGVPAHLDSPESSPAIGIGQPAHLCPEVSKGVPAHPDFPESSPAVSMGLPAHVDHRHSGLESGGSSNESHSHRRAHTPSEFSVEERSHAPTSLFVANAEPPAIPPPALGPGSGPEVPTTTLRVTNDGQLGHAEMTEMVTEGQLASTEGGGQLQTARLATAQRRNGYLLSPLAVRRQHSFGALEEDSLADAAQPETARSAVGDPETSAYFANMPQRPPEQVLDDVKGGQAPVDPHDPPGPPADVGKREPGPCVPSNFGEQGHVDRGWVAEGARCVLGRPDGGGLGQGHQRHHQAGQSQQSCQKTGADLGMLLCDTGAMTEGTGLDNASRADRRCSGGVRVVTHSQGGFDVHGDSPRCRSLKGEATPEGAPAKPELRLSTPFGTDTSPYVAKGFSLMERGVHPAPENVPACSYIKWDPHGSDEVGRGRRHEASGKRAEFLSGGGGMQWNGVGTDLPDMAAGKRAIAGMGKGLENEGGMGKAWQDRQADGRRNGFMTERVRQDIVTRGHCGVRDGASAPSCGDPLPVAPLSTAAANARAIAPMSLYPVDVAKGEMAPGEAGFPRLVHEPVWARAARVAAEVLNGPKSHDQPTADAEARAAQQLWWAAVRCAAASMSPRGSPEPFKGAQTQGLLETFSYRSCAPRPLGSLGHMAPSRPAATPLGYGPFITDVAPPRPSAIPLGYGPPADVAPSQPAGTPLGYGRHANVYSGHGGVPAGREMTAGFKEAGVPPWGANRAHAHHAWTSRGYGLHMGGHMVPGVPRVRTATPVPGTTAAPAGSAWTADDAAAVLVGLPNQRGFWEHHPQGLQQRRSPMPRHGTPQGHTLSRHPTPPSDMHPRRPGYPPHPARVSGTANGLRNPYHLWEGKTRRVADERPDAVITLSSTPGEGAASQEDGPEEMSPPLASTPVLETVEQLGSDSGSGQEAGEGRADQEMESLPHQGLESCRVSSPWPRAQDAGERGVHQEMESRRVPSPWPPTAATSGTAAPGASLRKHARKRSKPERAAEAAEPHWYEQHSGMHVPELGVTESVGTVKPSANSQPQGNPGRGQQSWRGRRRRGSAARTHIGQRRGRGRGAVRGRGRGQKSAASTGTWDPMEGVTSGAVPGPRHSARLQENAVSSRFATRKRRSHTRSPSPTGSGTINVTRRSATPAPRAQAAAQAEVGISARTTGRQTSHVAAPATGVLGGGARRGPGRPRSTAPVSAGRGTRVGALAQPYTPPCHGFLPKIKKEVPDDPLWAPGKTQLEAMDLAKPGKAQLDGGHGAPPLDASGGGLEGCDDAQFPLRVKGLRTPRRRPVPTLPQKRDLAGCELPHVVQKPQTPDNIRNGSTRSEAGELVPPAPSTGDVKGVSNGLVIAPLVQTSSAIPAVPAVGSAGREGPAAPVAAAETSQQVAPSTPTPRRPGNRGPKLPTDLKPAQKPVGPGRTPSPRAQASPSMFIHRVTKNLRRPKRLAQPFTLTSLRMLIGALGYYMSSRYHSLTAAGALAAPHTGRDPSTAWEPPVLLVQGRARLIRHSVMAYCLKVGTPHAIAAFVTGALTAARIALIMRVVPVDWQQHAACAPSVLPLAIQQVLRIPAAAAAAISAVVFAKEGEGRQPTSAAPPGSPPKRRRLSAPPVSNHPSAKQSLTPIAPDGTVRASATVPRVPDLHTVRPLQTFNPLKATATAGGGSGPTVPTWRPRGGATTESNPCATLQVKPLRVGPGGEQLLANPVVQKAHAHKPCPPLWKGPSRS